MKKNNSEKVFFFEIIASELLALNCLCQKENTCIASQCFRKQS